MWPLYANSTNLFLETRPTCESLERWTYNGNDDDVLKIKLNRVIQHLTHNIWTMTTPLKGVRLGARDLGHPRSPKRGALEQILKAKNWGAKIESYQEQIYNFLTDFKAQWHTFLYATFYKHFIRESAPYNDRPLPVWV